jgi:hypothetical protein
VSPSKLDGVNRLLTENVYLMMPIEDAIVDPLVVLTAGPDGVVAALSDLQDTSATVS